MSIVIWGAYSLFMPGFKHDNCAARAGTAAHLISQLDQAAEAYQIDYGVYPPGDGTGTRTLVEALSRTGPKKQKYFEFPADLLNAGNVVNPVWADGDPTVAIIYYRLNQKSGAGAGGGGGGGGSGPPTMRPSKFDIWCAGCDHTAADSKTQWSINNW